MTVTPDTDLVDGQQVTVAVTDSLEDVFDAISDATSGTVTATYRICNNGTPPCCDTATVTVTICNTDAVNDTPRVCVGAAVTIPVLANDTTNCGNLVPGTLAFVGTPPAGFTISGSNVVYTNAGTATSATVTATYRTCNNENPACCDTATVTVMICNTDAVNDTAANWKRILVVA